MVSSCTSIEKPILADLTIADLEGDISMVSCAIIDEGGNNVIQKGFELINEKDIRNNSAIIRIEVEGANSDFSTEIRGLTVHDAYYVRAFAVNEDGIGYSDSKRLIIKAPFHVGSVFLSSAAEVADFVEKGYEKVEGNLIIGSASTIAPETYLCREEIGGTMYYFTENNDIDNLSGLKLKNITGSVYVVGLQKETAFSWISSLENTETIVLRHNKLLNEISTAISSILGLKKLVVDNNSLLALDVSSNTQLEILDCANNNISLLDISGNDKLVSLNCSGNSLSALDISNATGLVELHCFSNRIDSISIRGNSAIVDLQCGLQVDSVNESKEMILAIMESQKTDKWDNGWYKDSFNKRVIIDGMSETGLPVVSTLETGGITTTSAVLRARVSDLGVISVVPSPSRGWYVSTTEHPSMDNYVLRIIVESGLGEFSLQVSTLIPNTVYYVRSFAKNGVGIAYGEENSFTTLAQ